MAAFTAVDPEGHGIQWTLAGTEAAAFSIDGGALTFKSTADFENPVGDDNIYEVTVQADDGDANRRTTESLVVNVINVDEDGIVTLTTLQPQEDIPLSAMLTDADGGSDDDLPITVDETNLTEDASWRWSRSSSKTGTFTNIAGAITENRTPTEDDVGMYLRATATYDDGEGEGKTAHMISANPVQAEPYENADPVFKNEYDEEITDNIERSVAEDASPGDPVGDPVVASDDARDVLTYTLGGTDASSFDIDSGTGQIKVGAGVTLDAETKASYSVSVTSTDPPGGDDDITVEITVINVDEAPTTPEGDTAKDYPENSAVDTPNTERVSNYMATDPEDARANPQIPVRWSLSGADSGKFSIAATGDLTFNNAPDFEAEADANSNNIYEVTVTATDSTGNTASRDVTVNVTNVDETGEVTLSTVQPEKGVPLTAVLTDPDGSISGVRWQWNGNGANTSSRTYTPVQVDLDSNLELTATATYTDGHGGGKSRAATSVYAVQENDPDNKAPVFPDQDPDRTGDQSSSTSRTVAENTGDGQRVGVDDRVKAEDCDPDPAVNPPIPCTTNSDHLTYSLEGRDKV